MIAYWAYGRFSKRGAHSDGLVEFCSGEQRLHEAYASARVSLPESSLFRVGFVRPSHLLCPSPELERTPWGYQFKDLESNSFFWSVRCPADGQVRAKAAKDWVIKKLSELDLIWAFEITVIKQNRSKSRWGYSLHEESIWTTKATPDKDGHLKGGQVTRRDQAYP